MDALPKARRAFAFAGRGVDLKEMFEPRQHLSNEVFHYEVDGLLNEGGRVEAGRALQEARQVDPLAARKWRMMATMHKSKACTLSALATRSPSIARTRCSPGLFE
jgi:hypothetical protein